MDLTQEQRSSCDMEEALLAPFEYLSQVPGKEIRTVMINAFNGWLCLSSTQLACIAGVVRKLHTASLMIDDVEDNSDLRRGIPVTHKIYGVPMTINTANYMYFVALQDVLKMNNPRLVEIFTEELLNLHRGQGMELYWRDTLTCPSEKQYLEMVSHKTGGLFRLAVKLMQECSETGKDFTELVNLIGAYFQIRDDYMNLQSSEYSNNKGYCEDLTEGKFSFVIVHAISKGDDGAQLMSILTQKTTDANVKKYAVGLMAKAKSFEYTREYLGKLETRINVMIREHGGSALLEELMAKLSRPFNQ
ncbi:terpenoid synthase [Coemansia reversa NRRL 1564]|uniref:Terpenoid synthase n=1 Tax=Coemansia reversa (strain ATCC 12441 / NRRL 1564) TaxID=763665 RepID=A0A2G5BG34_COERN|nr:terpenoid synthase [Coemansia reversa NRRL 1564]|eukprot:PIA17988.1 terpenoid synthase [Coemansia reversa NRRL 1564]